MKKFLLKTLRNSEKYTGTDMVYLSKNISWVSIGNGLSSLASLALVYVFGNYVSQHDYGIYQYVLSLAGILATPALSGMNTAVTAAISQGYEGTLLKALKIKIKWGLLSCLGSIGVGIYYYLQGNPILAMSFLGIAIFLPFMDSFSIFISYVEGKKQFKKSALYSFLISFIRVITLIGVIFITQNIIAIILFYFLITTLLRGAILLFILKNEKLNKKSDSESLEYGKHLSFMRIISNGVLSIENILLFHFLGAAQLAIYSFAKVPITKIGGIITPITSLAYPKFSQTEPEILKKTLPKKLRLLLLGMVGIVALYITLAPFLFELVLPQYTDSIIYSQIFALSLLFLPQKFLVSALTAHKQQKALYIINTVNPLLRVVLLIVLFPLFGIQGIIYAFLAGLLMNGILLSFYFKKM